MLQGVSRTFALNIKNLSGSLHDSVLSSYMICRLFDTVEDSPVLSVQEKCDHLVFLENCFVKGCTQMDNSSCIEVQKWGDAHQNITYLLDEKKLLKNVGLLWQFLQILPAPDKKFMISAICEMSQGMRWFIQEYSCITSSPKILQSQQHFKKYCYVVAGTIGNLLTDLFFNRINSTDICLDHMKKLGVAFGQGLQMTNILKDIFTDAKRDWIYLPNPIFAQFGLDAQMYLRIQHPEKNTLVLRHLIKQTQYCLKKGFLYIHGIPVTQPQIRAFCIIALFLSLKTLGELNKNTFLEKEYKNKISRIQVKKILFWIPFCSRSNTIFRCLYSHSSVRLG